MTERSRIPSRSGYRCPVHADILGPVLKPGLALTVTWDDVHRKRSSGGKSWAAETRRRHGRRFPISPALVDVLDELDKEREKLTSIHGASVVFTRDGKPIGKNGLRKAFDGAKKNAKVKDFSFSRSPPLRRHALDARRDPGRALQARRGHSRRSVHQRYINPPDEQMVKIFAESMGWRCNDVVTQELRQTAESAK